MYRGLIYYWRVNLAVLLGAAVAAAVLTGALLVGDSVRGSLRDLTLDRLGRIDAALLAQRFLREDVTHDLAALPGASGVEDFVPAIMLRGSAVHGETGARASRIAVYGIDERFAALFDVEALPLEHVTGQIFPPLVVNESLARELGAAAGDSLLVSFGRFSEVPRDTVMGKKAPEEVVASLRLTLAAVVPDRGLGRVGLVPSQQTPMNAYVALDRLQRELGLADRVNVVLAAGVDPSTDPDALLRQVLELDDLGLTLQQGEEHFSISSREFVLRPRLESAIEAVAAELGTPLLPLQAYLANELRLDDRVMPYSMVAALDPIPGARWGALQRTDGSTVTSLGDDGILLNRWAAEDLGARSGDSLEMSYFVVGSREELTVETSTFRVEGIVALEGLAADRSLTPDYPGIQDTEDMAAWDPPFPIDLSLVRDKDEDYWDRYGATPKAFVAGRTGRRLWSTRFGSTTSVRVGTAPGQDLAETRARFTEMLLPDVRAAVPGLRFRPVKQQGLEAAGGAVDFAALFVSFSMFLIVSSALLVGLLFSLGVEQRAREIGLRLAVGFPLRSVRSILMKEGCVLAAVGGLLGVAGGVGYAALMMAALRTLWRPAVGSSALYLHVAPVSLPAGWLIAVGVILLAIFFSVRRLKRVAPPALLAGSVAVPIRRGRRRAAALLAHGGLLGALALVGYAIATGSLASPAVAFSSAPLMLISGLAYFTLWCRGTRNRRVRHLLGMAARNSAWSPGRSILSVAMVGSACFMIVAVGANRTDVGVGLEDRGSGAGGYALVAESDVPLHQDLNRPESRFDLGFSEAESRQLSESRVLSFRLLPGDDTSCLNLYQPERPRILGVPDELVRRGGFRFGAVEMDGVDDNPWRMLEAELGPGVIPAIGDENSMLWILHLMPGQELTLEDEFGESVRLRLVGTLKGSLFQSEMLIPERAFLEHWPSQFGYSYFLVDAPFETASSVGQTLERRLEAFGFDSSTTGDKLAAYKVVEHTYMSTFQTLGGLGLLLGTIGLGVVLVRNVIERRGELATMRAFGFGRASLAWVVLAENAFLLLVGMTIGTVSALVSVAPRLTGVHVPWGSLGGTLLAITAVGMLACVLAVLGALRVPLLPALKAE